MFNKIKANVKVFRIMLTLYRIERRVPAYSQFAVGMWDKNRENFFVLYDNMLYSKPAADVDLLELWPIYGVDRDDVAGVYKDAMSFTD